ncbi:MAG: dTMP kinase [Rickettsiales bacterium]|jgi:dTMP kinase|nr:dTMP kinase [Rickettsiales bacterium]
MLEKLKGKFITFDGGEGVGKTTQSKLLVEYLNKNGIRAEWTREPGGCETAEKIREVLISNELAILTELLLVLAARLEHTEKKIKPLLKDGVVVVSDRYLDSSIAYQGFAGGMDLDKITELTNLVVGDFKPNITIVLDLDVEEGLRRANKRGLNSKYEDFSVEYHKNVRNGFLYSVNKNQDRIKLIDVSDKNIDDVHKEILNTILK